MTAELIAAVRRRPSLWNTDLAEYKHNITGKKIAWQEVVRECGLTDVKEAKQKWRRLRDGHRQAITRESSRGAVWKHEKSMSFLLPFYRRRTEDTSTKEFWYADKEDEETSANEDEDEEETQNFEYASTSGLKDDSVKASEGGDHMKAVDSKSGDPKEGSLEKFFSSMLLATQGLPERLQLRVQRQVFQAVMQAREEQLAGQTDCFD